MNWNFIKYGMQMSNFYPDLVSWNLQGFKVTFFKYINIFFYNLVLRCTSEMHITFAPHLFESKIAKHFLSYLCHNILSNWKNTYFLSQHSTQTSMSSPGGLGYK